jgi:DNA-binding CsgD family transcriptional regulator
MVMVRGEGLPVSGTLPLLPVAAALGELSRLDDGALLAAALDAAPGFVRGEVGRLLPQLAVSGSETSAAVRGDGWRQERLFAAVAELLDAVAKGSRSGVGLVVEDVHWADSATLDCLTFLGRAGRRGAVTVVATCRADEAPVADQVADWLVQVRGAAGVEEIRLGPLSRDEVAGQVAALAGRPVASRVVDELFARAEGNPFFTEQLVAAALADADEDTVRVPAGLPGRLTELLAARAGRCGGDARAVLAGLAVAGRPLFEDRLGVVTALDENAMRRGLRELAAARLLANDTAGGAHRPRHALLAEAVAAGLLPAERAVLHERTARAMEAAGDPALAAETAGHWQAAGRNAEELPARVTAAEAAEQVFGYAQAAGHWLRAIELCQAQPGAVSAAGIGVPQLYVRVIDALFRSGDGVRAGEHAEEAYHRYANHPDPATAAVACHRAAYFRAIDAPPAALPLMEEALRLFGQAPPSTEHAQARLDYARIFLAPLEGRHEASVPAQLHQALEIAEAAGATALIPSILCVLAGDAFLRGQVEEGLATLQRGWVLARASEDGPALVWLAVSESDALLKLAQFRNAADIALRGLGPARQAGLEAWFGVTVLAANASEALLALGRTAEAATLIVPLTAGPPDRDHWLVHEARAEIDLLRGDADAAAARRQLIDAFPAHISSVEFASQSAQRGAEVALWAGRPGDALDEVRRVLPLFKTPDLTILCGRLLTAGMRACADLAEQARARLDHQAASTAVAAADGLASWTGRMAGAPFTDHPFVATIPAERATWDAERTRLAGPSDPLAWGVAAKAWEDLACPHRAGYAWWRQAQVQLDARQPATAAAGPLRAAAAAADSHAPLLAQVRALADRARIPLHAPTPDVPRPPDRPTPYGLTSRELAVLRLLAAGRTNAQIGAELYISPKTASVHVTSIYRKLGVSGRVQAAALAERAGLLPGQQP